MDLILAIKTTEQAQELVYKTLNTLVGLGALIAVIMVIVAGFRYLTSAGNPEEIDRAKRALTGAIVGVILVVLSWAIIFYVRSIIIRE